jgi:hypothetical protein
MLGSVIIEKYEINVMEEQTTMKIYVSANGKTIVFELNNSPAARDLYSQLLLSIALENYSNNEKIFYPPKKLNTTDTSLADAETGTPCLLCSMERCRKRLLGG